MNPIHASDRCLILSGDARRIADTIEADSVDAIVTDPPYELGFMGKTWDASGIAFDPAFWREVLRVLKPGGHLLAFGGTRTYHRMTCAIEDAGFEIRDSLHWMYGTGFPKSLDVSKAMDKEAGAEREVVGTSANWRESKRDFEAEGFQVRGENAGRITAPATDLAKQWAGWGTALKPGHEPIVLARKPLVGTVAANVAQFGTGALNIDATRIEGGERPLRVSDRDSGNNTYGDGLHGSKAAGETTQGRWPANVLLDEDAAAELDAQSGTLKSGAGQKNTRRSGGVVGFAAHTPNDRQFAANEGGASRFFYVAKPSRAERDYGCEHLPAKSGGEATDREDGSAGTQNPRAGAGRTGGARNYHPTVKPIELMRYLCRLTTPPGGTVLDPFAGSGTTGIAALREGFQFIGVEQSEEYGAIAKARVERALQEVA